MRGIDRIAFIDVSAFSGALAVVAKCRRKQTLPLGIHIYTSTVRKETLSASPCLVANSLKTRRRQGVSAELSMKISQPSVALLDWEDLSVKFRNVCVEYIGRD